MQGLLLGLTLVLVVGAEAGWREGGAVRRGAAGT